MKLHDKIALVTGSGRGIGRAVALALAERGAHVVLCDIRNEHAGRVADEIRALGREAMVIATDLPLFVEVQRKQAAAIGLPTTGDWFPIRSLPPVDFVCRWAPAVGDLAMLGQLGDILAAVPELAPWRESVDAAVEAVALVERITKIIAAEPGVVQSTLPKLLAVDGAHAREVLWHLEQVGRITREKRGSSYALTLVARQS